MMNLRNRTFTVILNEAFCDPNINLNNLTGHGRIDVVCRIISSTFFLSNNFRKNTELCLLFKQSSKLLKIDGSIVRGINVDERAIAGVLKRIFTGKLYHGIYFTDIDWKKQLSGINGQLLIEDGSNSKLDCQDCCDFILGDQRGYDSDDLDLLKNNSNINSVSLGSKSYLASDTITILHYLVDIFNFESDVQKEES